MAGKLGRITATLLIAIGLLATSAVAGSPPTSAHESGQNPQRGQVHAGKRGSEQMMVACARAMQGMMGSQMMQGMARSPGMERGMMHSQMMQRCEMMPGMPDMMGQGQ